MKKLFLLLMMTLALTACGGVESGEAETEEALLASVIEGYDDPFLGSSGDFQERVICGGKNAEAVPNSSKCCRATIRGELLYICEAGGKECEINYSTGTTACRDDGSRGVITY